MSIWFQIVLIFLLIVIVAIIMRRIIKASMKIGRLQCKEFKFSKASFVDWESVLAHPGNIGLETLHAGDVPGTVSGLINCKNDKAANLEDKKLRAPLLAHLMYHDQYGSFLIDTGFDSEFARKPWGRFEGLLKKHFKYSVAEGQGIEEILAVKKVKLQGVFCTHFHEHQGGAPALPDDLPFVFGKGEKEMDFYPLIYSRFLFNKSDLQAIDFDMADEMPIVGKAVDVFGDGSFWAISTPGHTKGHISYLVNGKAGQYLITGDLCMCRKGFELGVESGGQYAYNLAENRESFLRIKYFIDTYSQVKPVFGHESEEFGIEYRQNVNSGIGHEGVQS